MRILATAALATCALAAGCGGGDEDRGDGADGGATTDERALRADLTVQVRLDGTRDRVRVRCREGDSQAACGWLREIRRLLTADRSGEICTQVYGGPETATVRGKLLGREVRRGLARNNGCRIAEWDRFFELAGRDFGLASP